MDKNHYTQIVLGVIGLIGVLGGAIIANWEKFKPEEADALPVVTIEKPPEVTTTCQYSAGPKAGTTEYFPPSTPGLRPTMVGYPCEDGLGSYGFAIPNKL